MSISTSVLPDSYMTESQGLPVVPALSLHDPREEQRADPVLRDIIHQLETNKLIRPTARAELPDLPALKREWNHLEI